MDIEKIKEICGNPSIVSNKDLTELQKLLLTEFDETKQLIIDLTLHMDAVEKHYNIVNDEIGKRMG